MRHVAYYTMVLLWLAGIVVAKGFAQTLVALVIPFYAYYLIVELMMLYIGVIY